MGRAPRTPPQARVRIARGDKRLITNLQKLGFGCVLVLLAVAAGAQQRPNSITFEDGEEGWMLLFYGSTLDDWTVYGDAEWRVENGAIVSDSGGPGLLLTVDEYENFEMVVDFLADEGTKSGVFLRTAAEPVGAEDFYEVNIAPPAHPFPTGSLAGREKVEGIEEYDDWRQLHIEVYEGEIDVRLDGDLILEYRDSSPIASGYIGLQHNEGRVAFRNIKIRSL
jgi:hypothetical protein